jgi:hypothetical protein
MGSSLAAAWLPREQRRNDSGTPDTAPTFLLAMLITVLGVSAMGSASAGALARLTADLPDVPAPPQGAVHWVAQSMRLNGMPMTVKTFESRLVPDDLFTHYQGLANRWGRNEYRRARRGGADTLSIRSRDYLITIEARRSIGGSEGTITVSKPPERIRSTVTTRFPYPTTARLVNCQEYEDDGIEAEHLSFGSQRTPSMEARAFVESLTRAGWQILRQQSMQSRAQGVVIEAQRGAHLAHVTLQPDQSRLAQTSIIVIWRKA